jgi:hypothetical protein
MGGMFTVEAPVGWHVIEAAVGGSDGAYIMVIERSQWVRAYVAVYPELVADTQTWGQTSGGGQTQTLLQVHLISERIWTEYFGSINSGPPVRTIINGRPAVWSRMQFVDDGRNYSGLGMTGMRIAPDDSWDEFEPIALRILKSIRLNQGVGRRPASATQRAPAR